MSCYSLDILAIQNKQFVSNQTHIKFSLLSYAMKALINIIELFSSLNVLNFNLVRNLSIETIHDGGKNISWDDIS